MKLFVLWILAFIIDLVFLPLLLIKTLHALIVTLKQWSNKTVQEYMDKLNLG